MLLYHPWVSTGGSQCTAWGACEVSCPYTTNRGISLRSTVYYMERTMKTQQKNVKINYKQTDRGAQLTMGDGKSSQVLSFQKSLNKKEYGLLSP